jgi:hypothetical protein
MTSDDMRTGLPPAFLAALAGQAGPQAPPVRLALQRVQGLPEGAARDGILLALLEGALHETAPQWLLEQAIETGLRKDQDPQWSTAGQVAAAALAHPACADPVRDKALHTCTAQQLGALMRRSRSSRLADAVAAHLGQREPAPQPMTVDRLKSPGTAEQLLAGPGLPDAVLARARRGRSGRRGRRSPGPGLPGVSGRGEGVGADVGRRRHRPGRRRAKIVGVGGGRTRAQRYP